MAARGWKQDRDARVDAAASPRPAHDADLMVSVGRNLASVYADVLCQPLPPRIADLIERLGAAAARQPRGSCAVR